ncbi:assimilatory nitrate reductase NasA [Halococcus sp. IIIV-5B]|uniref:assimilatory nitrate reductase NasA n=1 Tax=Halococcus sp. IIIV-5B TaxID=2321230 RepID=UPI001F37C1E3|nr:assimilatory nitrate reductase NasA [Halococcus sp. IIIV-5B]
MSQPVSTTCMRCAVGCGFVQRGVASGRGLDTVRGDVTHPVNGGAVCHRGTSETQAPCGDRLTHPLVRDGDELVPTSWDAALERVTEEFGRVLETDPNRLAVLGSGQQTNEAAYALGKLARGGFGTRNYDANTTLCMASAVVAYRNAFGSDAPPCSYDDIPEAETHLVWGANPAVAHPVLFDWIHDSATRPGSELVVVDPVETETAERADTHVSPAPGGDLALARAVLAQVVDTDRIDAPFIERATTRFGKLVRDLPDPATAAAEAGVTLDAVETIAAALTQRTLLYWGMGVNQSVQGTETAGALIDLCLATGNLRPGSGPFSLAGQANSLGARSFSPKGTWPGHRDFADPDERAVVADHWGIPVERLPDTTGPGPVGVVEAAGTDVDALWTVASNPVTALPDKHAVRERFEDAFLVVQDAFRNETAEFADVVLPAATWGEVEGTTTNMDRRISRIRAATDPPNGVPTDLDLVTTIGERLSPGLFEATTPSAVFDECVGLTSGTTADCSGISYDRLDRERAVRWPAPDPDSAGGYRYCRETEGGAEWRFPMPTGRARFSWGVTGDPAEPPTETYPLTLTTGRRPERYNTGVRSPESDSSTPVARVNPETAATLGDDDPDLEADVRVESRRGSVLAALDPDPAVPEGLVWLPVHHPATNELTIAALDPESAEPNYKQCAVRLAPVERWKPKPA